MPSALNDSDLNYYRSRMAAELALANSSGDPHVARAHRELAAKYRGLTSASVPDDCDLERLAAPVAGIPGPPAHAF